MGVVFMLLSKKSPLEYRRDTRREPKASGVAEVSFDDGHVMVSSDAQPSPALTFSANLRRLTRN